MNTLTILLTEDQLEDLALRIATSLSPAMRKPLSVAEAAEVLGLSRSAIERQIHAGEIRRVPHTGRRILIPRAEIERLQKGDTK